MPAFSFLTQHQWVMWTCSSHLGELRMIQASGRVYHRPHASFWVDNHYPSFFPGKQAYWTFHARIKDQIHHNRIMRKWMRVPSGPPLKDSQINIWQFKDTNQILSCSLCNIFLNCTSPWEWNYKKVINVSSKRNKVSSKSQVHLCLLLHFWRGLHIHLGGLFSFSKVNVCSHCGDHFSVFAVYRDLFLKMSDGKAINNDITPFYETQTPKSMSFNHNPSEQTLFGII